MFPASTKGGGTAIAFPDVCKTPAPPAPFVPTPYPNTDLQKNLRKAGKVDAAAARGSKKAKKQQKAAIKSLAKAVGDEAGVLKGVMSNVTTATKAVRIGYSMSVNGIGRPTASSATSIPMGLRAVPSQVKVIVMG